MRKVTVAAIQMNNTRIVSENIAKAEKLVREAAEKGCTDNSSARTFRKTVFLSGKKI